MDDESPEPGPSRSRGRSTSRNRMGDNNSWRRRDNPDKGSGPFRMGAPNTQNGQFRQMRNNNDSSTQRPAGFKYQNKDPSRTLGMRGGRDNNMRTSHENERIKFIGFRTLEEIARGDAKDVLQKINEKRSGFMNLVNSPIDRHDVFVLLIEILSKISESPFVELKSKLILDVCNSNFITGLRYYLVDLPYVENKLKNNLYWKNQTEFWINFIKFCGDIVDASPSTALRKCRALIESISKTCLECLNQNHGYVLSPENVLKLDEIRQKMISYGDKYQPEEKKKRLVNEDIQPPENFRELSVVPTREDLLSSTPFLRPNIVEGGYNDVEHYLDVQFRLLREDCFGPFRDGINQFLGDPNKRKYEHVRIYHNVRFVCPYVENLKVGALVQIDMQNNRNFQRINWAHNKRFLFGSLVLFTKDHCSSFMAATIIDRDVNLLSNGKLPVSIIDTHLDNSFYNGDTYTMIESEVYFEPYFHVLKALQEPSFPQHLAMQQYIVKVDPSSKPPAYLNADKKFVIRDGKLPHRLTQSELLEKNALGIVDEMTDDDDDDDDEELDEHNKKIFKVLQPETWPTKEELNFNESQYEAYRLALTHEFAVIQGPPGTGKTYIGINVAKTLLHNVEPNGKCLMLIICYTNHALDQFLEAISKITNSIVRIGGQSRNKAMDEFNLATLRRKSLTPSLYATHSFFIEQKNILRNSIEDLQWALKYLDILNDGVVSYKSVKEDVPELNLLDSYYKDMGKDIEDPLEYWLFETKSDYHRHFNDCLIQYDVITNNEEDIDNKRQKMILDDDKTLQVKETMMRSFLMKNSVFLLTNAKSEIRKLVALYKGSTNFNERYLLQREIHDLDARINLYNDMEKNRHREVRLHIGPRTNFSAMTVQNRWCLYYRWIRNKIIEVKNEIARLQESVSPLSTGYEEARMMMDVQLLKDEGVKVIGMTTSGAARMRKLLQAMAPKIVIVEEAAEVLEQHIITSLTQDCQHLILIGDHQQLRPSASHIKLAKLFNMEVSLFERMITNGIHSRRLNVQHRMRPEIAALICPHIYPDLANHPSVEAFSNVPGIEKNMYFFTHNYKEEELNENKSRENHTEADMTLALANYLMQQGYNADDITILAAYSGQMFYMRKERQNYASLSQVKITVVDNYQGEESKIILLSLVRNNSENSIGFLGTENRICVALSRAKQGFYIFGNIDMLKEKSELWRKIAVTLESNGSLGTALKLICHNHPDQITTISTPDDFNKIPPEGGCFQICNYQYHCGHRCQLYCHGYDREHIKTKCIMKCERVICDLGHVCPLKCRDDCEPCKVYVLKTLPCGHEMNLYCYREPEDPRNQCLTQIEVTLPNCGHKAQKSCYMDVDKVSCPEPCRSRLEKCGHVCGRRCHVTHDPNHEDYICVKACARAKAGCSADLVGDRGDHQCRKPCHEKCDDCHVQVVKKRSTCKHVERIACCKIVDEIPCKKKCTRTMSCGHFCKKQCFEKCGDCTQMVEKIIPECNHKIKVECRKTPSRELCAEKCTRVLYCGHSCKDRCGAVCDATKCKVLMDSEIPSPCGHKIRLPCNMSASHARGELKPEQLLQFCRAACGATLACSHVCSGTCARCHQGRLHQPCIQTCNRDNICGHQCQEPCNQICPPCKMFCEVKCPHSHCKRLCGEPCVPCQEKCRRKCVHGACTRRCGEPCDRPPCSERCSRRLACGHACRGLCGEPCPDICRLCRPDEFPTDFTGDEYGDDDKFILLQDCGHVLEVENMDNLMLGQQENIMIHQCPFCRKPIINTNRYKDTVNNMFKNDINPIKVKVYGTTTQIKKKVKEFAEKVQAFSKYAATLQGNKDLKATYGDFINISRAQKNVSLLQVEMHCLYLSIFEMIVECWQVYNNRQPATTTLQDEFQKYTKILLNVLKINPRSKTLIKISEQQQKDINNEIKRLNVIVKYSTLLDKVGCVKSEPKIIEHIKTTKATVFTSSIFNEDEALKSLKEFQEMIKSSGIITKYERASIVKAIGLKAGHWYKCPNGHFYCIGECGGAMQRSTCPDCGATIGGTSHTLDAGNSHAPEMDGSRFAAWSEQNNLANFHINDLH